MLSQPPAASSPVGRSVGIGEVRMAERTEAQLAGRLEASHQTVTMSRETVLARSTTAAAKLAEDQRDAS